MISEPFLALTRHVRADLVESRLWYDRQKPGLGDDFADEFYATLDRILHAPTAQPRFGTRFRKRRLHTYPYSVYFHVAEPELFILALIHHRRSPEFISDQLTRS